MVRRAQPSLTPEQRRKRVHTYVGIGCGSLLLLAVGGVLGVYLLLHSRPPVPGDVRDALAQAGKPATAAPSVPGTGQPAPGGQATPGFQPTAPAAAAPPVDQQMDAIRQAVQRGYRGPARVVLTEADLNQHLSEGLGTEVSSATVAILDNRVVAQVELNLNGRHFTAYVEARPMLEGNRPRVILDSAYVGRIPVPRDRLTTIQAKIDEEMQRAVDRAGATQVTGLTTTRGQIILDAYVGGQ